MTWPTADVVACVVVAAAEVQRVHPLEVLGQRPTKVPVAAARARAYAAMALDEVFNGVAPETKHGEHQVPRTAIARMVGVPKASQPTFVQGVERRLRERKDIAWWRPQSFATVVRAARGEPTRELAQVRKPAPAPAPPPPRRAEVLPALPPAMGKGDVLVDLKAGKVHRADIDKTATIDDLDAIRLVGVLSHVMPDMLLTADLAARVWGHDREAEYRIRTAADRANAALVEVRLKIRAFPKMGFALSEA